MNDAGRDRSESKRWGKHHVHAGACGHCASQTGGRCRVARGIRRCNRLRTAGRHITYAVVERHRCSIGRVPGKGCRRSRFYCRWVYDNANRWPRDDCHVHRGRRYSSRTSRRRSVSSIAGWSNLTRIAERHSPNTIVYAYRSGIRRRP